MNYKSSYNITDSGRILHQLLNSRVEKKYGKEKLSDIKFMLSHVWMYFNTEKTMVPIKFKVYEEEFSTDKSMSAGTIPELPGRN